MSTSEWLAEIGRAADELGWLVEEVSYGRITLRLKRRPDVMIVIDSPKMSGALLRELLREQAG
jgi:hypothetical protein